jgi:hypothetical protein
MRPPLPAAALSFVFLFALSIQAQTIPSSMPNMPGTDTDSMQMTIPQGTPAAPMDMDRMNPPTNLIESELSHTTSGTTVEPASTPVSMLMRNDRGWMLMLHGGAFLSDIQQHAASNPSPT